MDNPNVIVLSGPNGAGKSTVARTLLSGEFGNCHYINADAIARGLSAFRSEEMAAKAARVMLEHLRELAAQRQNFAFETTLSGRAFATWIAELKQHGYRFHLIYIWVASPEVSISRVRDRVMLGGHSIPEETIRRRYQRGLVNFFRRYQPLATSWLMLDNSARGTLQAIAEMQNAVEVIHDQELWNSIRERGLP